MNLFITTTFNQYGVYAVKFFKNSQWVTVIIDDLIPVGVSGKPVFAKCLNKHEVRVVCWIIQRFLLLVLIFCALLYVY